MHDIDRTLPELEGGEELEYPGELGGELESFLELEEPGGEFEAADAGAVPEFEGEYEAEEGLLSEAEEMELAAELVNVSSEAELEQFLGKVFRAVRRGLGGAFRAGRAFFRRGVGGMLTGVLRRIARRGLPFASRILGGMVGDVAVALPPSDGVRGAGAGAGIAAKQLESPGSSYFAAGEDWRFGQMDVEYAIDLLHQTAGKPSSGLERSAAAPPAPDAQVRPNPFNPAVAIELSVPRAAQVQVDIYDIGGRLVRALLRAKLEPGVHHQGWDGRDDRGQPAATGIYLAKVRIGDTLITRKLALLR